MWEHTPLKAIHAGEQSALAGRRRPQELLIGSYVPGSTSWGERANFGALAERRPLLEPCTVCDGEQSFSGVGDN
jgi:hypothetical protein